MDREGIAGEVAEMRAAGWQPPNLFTLTVMEAWSVKEAGFPSLAEAMLSDFIDAYGASMIGKAMNMILSASRTIQRQDMEERASARKR